MASSFKIAFDSDSYLQGDPNVNFYQFDAVELTDGSNTQIIKTDFEPMKVDVNPTVESPNTDQFHNGHSKIKDTLETVHDDPVVVNYIPFTNAPQTLNLNVEQLKVKALIYKGIAFQNLTFIDSDDGNTHYVINDTLILQVRIQAPISKSRTYHFDWIEDQGWTIDNPLFYDSVGKSHKLVGSPMQAIAYNKDSGQILQPTNQYNLAHTKYSPIYPETIDEVVNQTTSISVLDEWISPQNPKDVLTKDQLGYVIAPQDVSLPDTISDLIANINRKYTNTFYWDPRPRYDPDKYDYRSLVTDGIIYPLNDTFYVNFLNSPYFLIPLLGVTFNNSDEADKHKNDVIDVEILLNNVVISTQTVNVSNPILEPIDALTFNQQGDVSAKPTIEVQTNSLYYSIERTIVIHPDQVASPNDNSFEIVYNPYPSSLSGYQANEKSLEKTVPVVGSYIAVTNIDNHAPVLSIQSIDFITGDIILSNNSTRKLTD